MVDFGIPLEKSKHNLFNSKDVVSGNPNLYAHFKYRSLPPQIDTLKMTPEEKSSILSLLSTASVSKENNIKSFLSEKVLKKPKKLIIDTDLGTDFDDTLAILMLLHLDQKDAQLLGITTNYHPTLLRKRIIEMILRDSGPAFEKIPVVAGTSILCGSHRQYYRHGNEGKGLGFTQQELSELNKVHNSLEATEFLYKTCKENPGEVTIVSIGIPTNLGLCAYLYEDFEKLVGHIVFMGGGNILEDPDYIEGELLFPIPNDIGEILRKNSEKPEIPGFHLGSEYNISGDSLASKFLMALKCPITVVPLNMTRKFWLRGLSIETLLSLKDSNLGNEIPLCGKLAFEWLSSRNERGQCPHDPLALYEAIYPEEGEQDGFEFGKSALNYMRGTCVVHEEGGFLTFVSDAKGPHRMAIEPKEKEKWLRWLEETLISNVGPENRTADSKQSFG